MRWIAPIIWTLVGAVLMATYSFAWRPHEVAHAQIAQAINALHQRVTALEQPKQPK